MIRYVLVITLLGMFGQDVFADYKEALNLFQKKKYRESLTMVAELLTVDRDMEKDSPNYKLRFLAAHNHWKLGNYDSAIAHLKRCMEIRKDAVEPYIDISLLLADIRRFKDSESYARKGLSVKEDAMLYSVLGTVSLGYRNYWRAKEFFEKSISLNPELYISYNGLGIALMNVKKYSEANTAFSAALALKADSPEILNNIALSLEKLEKYDDALRALKKAQAVEPENEVILENVKRIEGKVKKE